MNRMHGLLTTTFLLLLACALGADPASSAPDRQVSDSELPVAATCGALQGSNLTHVMVLEDSQGVRSQYLVAGQQGVYNEARLLELFKQRAGTQRPSPHAVWITASAESSWAEVFKIMQLASGGGLYRIGMRVRHPEDGRVYGMPFFIPAAVDETNVDRSVNRLPLKVEQVLQPNLNADESKEIPLDPTAVGRGGSGFEGGTGKVRDFKDSSLERVYSAARVAIDNFGEVVVELWIDAQVRVGYAVKLVDYLYRAGAAGVRLKGGRLQRRFNAPSFTRVRVVRQPRDRDVMIPDVGLKDPAIPTPKPRAGVWPIHGANQPGALTARMLELPVRNENTPRDVNSPHKRWANYLRKGTVPDAQHREAGAWIRKWSLETGRQLLAGLRGQQEAAGGAMVVRFAKGSRFREVWQRARQTFPDAVEVLPATLQFDVYLIDRVAARGKATLTMNLVGDRLGYVFANWSNEKIDAQVALPPEPVDLFAAGVPGAIRVWMEKAFADARRGGGQAFPLTPAQIVYKGLPAAAHGQVAGALQGRAQKFAQLGQALQQIRYDRLLMVPKEGSAAVIGGGQVLGVLRFEIESEEKELRIGYLTPLRAK